jgi:hypothetical protein
MATDGKWRKLRGKLPAYVNPEPGWTDKVEEAKKQYVGLDTTELARQFKMQKEAKAAAEAAKSAANIQIEAISRLLLGEMESNSVELVKLASGGTVYINDEPYASVQDRTKVMRWIKENKAVFLLSIQFQSLNSLCKQRIIDGQKTIPGVKIFIKTNANVRGLKGIEETDAKDKV